MLGRDHMEHRFYSLWGRVNGRGDPLPILQDIFWRYSEPHRAYHVIDHLVQGFEEFDAVRGPLRNTEAFEFAWWLHDIIYNPRSKTNEEDSADLARKMMESAHIGARVIEETTQYILNTKHDSPLATDSLGELLVDIDLSILGKDPEIFDRYEEQIRAEYAWVPEVQYRIGRSQILQTFLDRSQIYSASLFISMYERQARANLARSIEKLMK